MGVRTGEGGSLEMPATQRLSRVIDSTLHRRYNMENTKNELEVVITMEGELQKQINT